LSLINIMYRWCRPIMVVALNWLQAVQAVLASTTVTSPDHITFDTPSYYPGAPFTLPPPETRTNTCYVEPAEDGGDSAPAILSAFERCRHNGNIIFHNTTYHIGSIMTTTGLSNVNVDVRGTLIWSTDIQYWLANSLPMGYQNQSTAWYLGESVGLRRSSDS
jgi:galacturan 1,4-alpha-galacturonidase